MAIFDFIAVVSLFILMVVNAAFVLRVFRVVGDVREMRSRRNGALIASGGFLVCLVQILKIISPEGFKLDGVDVGVFVAVATGCAATALMTSGIVLIYVDSRYTSNELLMREFKKTEATIERLEQDLLDESQSIDLEDNILEGNKP